MGNKAREINSPLIQQLIDQTTPEELAKIDTEMTNNKQQTAVDVAELAMKLHPFSNSERNAFINGYNKAKEMEKEIMIQFCIDWFISREMNIREYYDKTDGGGEQ